MDKIFSPIKSRLVQYVEYKGITKDLFFKNTGISPSNFKGSGAKSQLGGEIKAKILTIYTDINPNWLLTGHGPMLKQLNQANEPIQDYPSCKFCEEKDHTINALHMVIDSLHTTINLLKEKISYIDKRSA